MGCFGKQQAGNAEHAVVTLDYGISQERLITITEVRGGLWGFGSVLGSSRARRPTQPRSRSRPS